MEQHPEPEAVDDFMWSVVHKLVLCHFFQEGNKRTARNVANSVFVHFNMTAWVWRFEALKDRQPYQIGFMKVVGWGYGFCETSSQKLDGRKD